MVAGVVVVWGMLAWVKPYPESVQYHVVQLLSIILIQPVFEEILFRGIIQGQLGQYNWGKRSWLIVSHANILTSIIFVAMHMINSPPLHALSILAPSLVFGYFRDKYQSVYPAIVLHASYNAMVFIGLMISNRLEII